MRACIFGASGGIGRALSAQLITEGAAVYAGARSAASGSPKEAIPFTFDLNDEKSIVRASAKIESDGSVDLVVVATGLLHRGEAVHPERTYRSLDPAMMAAAFAANAIGPALIAKHMLPLLNRCGRPVFAVLSARVGSTSDNRLGGWHSYRASKAALNSLVKNFAIELRSRNKAAVAVSLHPGTVDTPLSEPFRNNLKPGQLFTPEHSARSLLKVIAGLAPSDSGGFFAWDGRPIEY